MPFGIHSLLFETIVRQKPPPAKRISYAFSPETPLRPGRICARRAAAYGFTKVAFTLGRDTCATRSSKRCCPTVSIKSLFKLF